MGMLEKPILLMALAIILAIGIERLLELVRAIEDYYEARNGNLSRWQRIAERLRDRIELRLEIAKGGGHSTLQRVLTMIGHYLSPAPAGSESLIAIASDRVRTLTISFLCKLYGVLLGIVFAFIFNLDLFALVNASIHQSDGYRIVLPAWLGILLSGVAMGFGASPVHKLITTLERVGKIKR